jgi:pyruvate,orthophosphate dikinase
LRGGKDAKRIYYFGKGHAEGDASMKTLLGVKGANCAEMAKVGLSVPPGFTITTQAYRYLIFVSS